MKKNILLKNTDENNMIAEIEVSNFTTQVRFGFNPSEVQYLGCIDKSKLEKII